jgi:2-polyprenyl-3-methyl-5-hydroxy-6-metoxy-1,4-benzoquinol methylase
MEVKKCRSCGYQNLKEIISLGNSPLANNLLDSMDEIHKVYPLTVNYCENCHNCQLSYSVPSDEMFEHYLYVSSTAASFRNHFKETALNYIKEYKLDSNSIVVDIGSNDGIFLKPLKENGIKIIGVEPAKNIAKIANDDSINTINDYFTKKVADNILTEFGKVDLITASNVFAHADNLEEIAKSVFEILKDDGTFIIEVQYLLDTIKDLTFDNIYHEHVNYWSVTSLNNFFNRLGFVVYKIEHINTHGGSIRVFVSKNRKVENSVSNYLDIENHFGIKKFQTYIDFKNKIEKIKQNIRKNINKLKSDGFKLVGFGAPAKATTSLNYFELNQNHIEYIVEDNKLKHNKFVPGMMIPIYSKDMLSKDVPDIIIVFAWNFFDDIVKNNKELIESGIKFINIKSLQEENFIN